MATISMRDGTEIRAAALLAEEIVKNATLEVYQGAPHGLTAAHKDRVNEDLLSFLQA